MKSSRDTPLNLGGLTTCLRIDGPREYQLSPELYLC